VGTRAQRGGAVHAAVFGIELVSELVQDHVVTA
jgi:hypothetical protein